MTGDRASPKRTGLAWVIHRLEKLTEKRLGKGQLWDDDAQCACAMGAVLPPSVLVRLRGLDSLVMRLPHRKFWETWIARWAALHGLTPALVARLEHANDSVPVETPEERYAAVITELRRVAALTKEEREEWIKQTE